MALSAYREVVGPGGDVASGTGGTASVVRQETPEQPAAAPAVGPGAGAAS